MENHIKRPLETSKGPAVLRTWVWDADVHSTLFIVGSQVELRVERDGIVIRRGQFNTVRRALEAAQEWRVEYALQRAQCGDTSGVAIRCPECRDEIPADARARDGHRVY